MKRRLAVYAVVAFIVSLCLCSPSEETLNNADQRIKTLKSKGVPDSSLSPALVCLYQARETKRKSERGESAKAAKQLKIELAKAENIYRENIATLKPAVDSIKDILNAAKRKYSGLELKKFDSAMTLIDSLIGIDWMLQAHTKAQVLLGSVAQFNFDSDRSKELRERIPGAWECATVTKSNENTDVKAVEKKIFTFEKDGKALLVENKKGQSGPYLKEDWEFVSYGTWDVNGDTIHLFINRFKIAKQMIEKLYIEDGGKTKTWKKEPGPTYDSAITDGSQNRFITFSDLKEDFQQKTKF